MGIKYVLATTILKFLPDRQYLKLLYKYRMNKKLDLKNPKALSEKIQWLKLYDRKDIYTTMVDKHDAKLFISEKVGSEYVIPTIGVWDSFDEIDFDKLPEKFVIKTTHDSGSVFICQNKNEFDLTKVKEALNKSLKRNYYYNCREWPYKNVKPRIIVEEFVEDLSELVEYKVFCFNGKAKMVLVCKGKAHSDERTNDYCDLDLNRLPFTVLYPNSKSDLPRPKELDKMIELSEKLSENVPFLRNDFYLSNGKIYVGELTFFHNAGTKKFEPEEWDYKLGEWLELPKK